jgi:hypothetical protein
MKKLFNVAILGAIGYSVFRFFNGQKHTEALWREATRDLDVR